MKKVNKAEWDRFLVFAKLQLETADYDAHHPFLTRMIELEGISPEDAAWLCLLYMGLYNEGSAYVAFHHPKHTVSLPMDPQRRNLYGGRLTQHLDDMRARANLFGGFRAWLLQGETDDPLANWKLVYDRLGMVYGNGRWGQYTTTETLQKVLDWPLEPPDLAIADSSGPRAGVRALWGEGPVSLLERWGEATYKWLLERVDEPIDRAQTESILCDWAGMNKGTFYAGRNIDRQQGRIHKVLARLPDADVDACWTVREDVFPDDTLGEVNGWEGIDSERLGSYQRTRKVLAPWEDR